MRRFLFTLWLAVALCAVCEQAFAQRIAYGERTPKIDRKHSRWFDGRMPVPDQPLLIAFVYSHSNTCLEFCYGLKRRMQNAERPLQVILVTREPASMIDMRMKQCLDGNITVVSDVSGRIFRDFGVNYVPFAVVVDERRKAVWFGNPLTSERDIFNRHTVQSDDRRSMRKQKKSKSR